jgi:dTDP-4-amino-4,6-dideoxygalactose transaminase
MSIPFLDVRIKDSVDRSKIGQVIKDLIDNASFIGGKEVEEFTKSFGAFCGDGSCVTVANGTDALILALKALGVGPGDEVITVPFTFIATSEAITHVGASVKFVDIHPKSYTMDPNELKRAITPRTKAIIPVHLYGQPADMDPINAIAKEQNIFVIEDAAQAHGAEYKGRRVGTLGDIACFSFYPTKNLGAIGDGGMVVTNDAKLAQNVRLLREYGWEEHTSELQSLA